MWTIIPVQSGLKTATSQEIWLAVGLTEAQVFKLWQAGGGAELVEDVIISLFFSLGELNNCNHHLKAGLAK